MDSSIPDKPADKSTKKSTSKKVVVLSHQVHGQVEKAAKKFKTTNSEFASAAITYFAENGLDPRTASKSSLAKIENRVVQEAYDVREHNANIGNRLVGVIRTFERNISLMIQQQQAGTFKYLEGIERNILGYLMNVEEDLLTTILERAIASNVENHMNRVMLQIVGLQLDEKRFPFSEAELSKLTASYDQQRNEQILVESRKLLESKKTARPRASVGPGFVEIPKAPVAAKPKTETPSATTETPPAASAVAATSI